MYQKLKISLEYIKILWYTLVNSRRVDFCLLCFIPMLGGIMNSKNIKVVDEHSIDRSASVMFGFELDGSGYVTYSIERDEDNSNVFISKILRNFDNTFSMVDIDDSNEKSMLVDIVKVVITNAVESQADKNNGDSLTLNDGKIIKFMNVSFNKEQRINVQKTYITTVKKEVIRVVEKFYELNLVFEQQKVVDEIFPSVSPVVTSEPIVTEPVIPTVAVSTPTVEVKPEDVNNNAFFGENSVNTQVNSNIAVEPVVQVPVVEVPQVNPVASVVEPITAQPTLVTPDVAVLTENLNNVPENVSDTLIFNASKETNLNEALGEIANNSPIPVENIEPIREFGVETPLVNSQIETPKVDNMNINNTTLSQEMVKKGGFVNNKFFMVIAISFFLASCVFLGYEVFNYFQLTK